MKKFVRESNRGKLRFRPSLSSAADGESLTEEDLVKDSLSYVELEKRLDLPEAAPRSDAPSTKSRPQEKDEAAGRTVDIVLSDMSEPWEQTDGFWKRSLSDPYYRMMNTSGINTRDHAGSMVSFPLAV